MRYDLKRLQNQGIDDFCRFVESVVILDICPRDFGKTPLYVIRQSLPSVSASGRVRAFTHPEASSAFEKQLRAARRWHGNGAVIIVDAADAYSELYAKASHVGCAKAEADQFGRCSIIATILHELAHICTDSWPKAAETPIEPEKMQKLFAGWTYNYASKPPSGISSPVPFAGHGATFLRAAAHLAYRARLCGFDIPIDAIADGSVYGLSRGKDYFAALGDEPARLQAVAFGAPSGPVGATPPKPFVDLWRADIRKWWRSIPGTPSDGQKKAALDALTLYPSIS